MMEAQQVIPVDFRKKALRNVSQSKHETEAIWRMCSNGFTRLKLIKMSAETSV